MCVLRLQLPLKLFMITILLTTNFCQKKTKQKKLGFALFSCAQLAPAQFISLHRQNIENILILLLLLLLIPLGPAVKFGFAEENG